jgi:hypothetical protein
MYAKTKFRTAASPNNKPREKFVRNDAEIASAVLAIPTSVIILILFFIDQPHIKHISATSAKTWLIHQRGFPRPTSTFSIISFQIFTSPVLCMSTKIASEIFLKLSHI